MKHLFKKRTICAPRKSVQFFLLVENSWTKYHLSPYSGPYSTSETTPNYRTFTHDTYSTHCDPTLKKAITIEIIPGSVRGSHKGYTRFNFQQFLLQKLLIHKRTQKLLINNQLHLQQPGSKAPNYFLYILGHSSDQESCTFVQLARGGGIPFVGKIGERAEL